MSNRNDARTVYSTESGRICPACGQPFAACRCKKKSVPAKPAPTDGIVRVGLEKKGRGGKTVSVISGLRGSEEELKTLAADLKHRCGTGGTLKNGIIEIQGDHRETLLEVLRAKGIPAKRGGG
jgi:translation initiation factor 1